MQFCEKLMELRKARGLSQEQLGDLLNVSRQTVSKWELGATTPEMNKLIELSNIFSVSIDELVGNETAASSYGTNENMEASSAFFRFPKLHYEYRSKRSIGSLPLVHVNLGRGAYKATGVIAIGNAAVGVVSLGLASVGILSFGVASVGLFSLGSLAIGLLSLGAISIGGLAIGGLAVGIYALGGFAVASRIALGGFATGTIAIGDIVHGTREFVTTDHANPVSTDTIKQAIYTEFPKTWSIIADIFSVGGRS